MTIPRLHVYSEVGPLRSVLLHKPGRALDNMTPSNMKRLLFDDIPDRVRAGEEFEAYLKLLHAAKVETVYVEDLLAKQLDAAGQREAFLDDFLALSWDFDALQLAALKEYYLAMEDSGRMLDALIEGLRKEAPGFTGARFAGIKGKDDPLILDPLPNLYFTRDPFMVMGTGVVINKMFYPARRRETLMAQYLFEKNESFEGAVYRNPAKNSYIEGGDILILNEECIAIGLSQRTNRQAIEQLAAHLFSDPDESKLKYVLAMKIPSTRAFMHLDTVFTMLDKDAFVIHAAIEESLEVIEITSKDGQLAFREIKGDVASLLRPYLKVDKVRLIRCGGGSLVDGEREQWSDGSNVLALAPGELIVYDRNHVTNRILEEEGFRLHPFPCSEVARGRGGPHCMSMPLHRALCGQEETP